MGFISQIKKYEKIQHLGDFIPLYPWNKKIKGISRGKTPVHMEWQIKKYAQSDDIIKKWIRRNFNIGFRLKAQAVVIDIDPRNFKTTIDSFTRIAKFFQYDDIGELLWDGFVVKTGRDDGGFHIYCEAPADVDTASFKKCIPQLPGVDFKRAGGYVVAAGSRHPLGGYYEWENCGDVFVLGKRLCRRLIKDENVVSRVSRTANGYGAFTGTILYESVLSKLDPSDYSSNDQWEPLLMAAHHATAGEGVDDFVAWSLQDDQYADQEDIIRQRWESLSQYSRGGNSITAATLIHALKEAKADSQDAIAALDFNSAKLADVEPDDEDVEQDEDDWDYDSVEKEEEAVLSDVTLLTKDVDIEALVKKVNKDAGVAGKATEFAKQLHRHATAEQKMMAIRLINAADIDESLTAQEVLVERKIMRQSAITKRLKALEGTIVDSLSEILANTTIDVIFKHGKHIVAEPNSQLWIFRKTHWLAISDLYLGKIIYSVLDMLKVKMEVKARENSIVNQAKNTVAMRSSVLKSKIFNVDKMLPIINCRNGEVWIKNNGSPALRPHHYQSYQVRHLDVTYDPSAECPLFSKTLCEIFDLFDDRDDIIRHVWEILGYIIQPYKPDAQWWLFKGAGGDGKSLIIKVLAEILGDAFYSADAKVLRLDAAYGDNHGYAKLVGKLLVCIEELPSGGKLADSGLKMLSENRRMTCNPKKKDDFSFNYFGSVIMCSNFYPKFTDTSEGMLRRANVIPFNQNFVKRGVDDLDLPRRIVNNKDEMGGVLNLMLQGYKRYRERGRFLVPSSCSSITKEWVSNSNNVFRFAAENITLSKDKAKKMGKASEIYDFYSNWCHEEGINSRGRNNFYDDLINFGLNKKKSYPGVMCLFGGEIKDFEKF